MQHLDSDGEQKVEYDLRQDQGQQHRALVKTGAPLHQTPSHILPLQYQSRKYKISDKYYYYWEKVRVKDYCSIHY